MVKLVYKHQYLHSAHVLILQTSFIAYLRILGDCMSEDKHLQRILYVGTFLQLTTGVHCCLFVSVKACSCYCNYIPGSNFLLTVCCPLMQIISDLYLTSQQRIINHINSHTARLVFIFLELSYDIRSPDLSIPLELWD